MLILGASQFSADAFYVYLSGTAGVSYMHGRTVTEQYEETWVYMEAEKACI